jgi:hypothetical protein
MLRRQLDELPRELLVLHHEALDVPVARGEPVT